MHVLIALLTLIYFVFLIELKSRWAVSSDHLDGMRGWILLRLGNQLDPATPLW